MELNSTQLTAQFKKQVIDKYTIYNSLFAALPYSGVANVGAMLPILLEACEKGYEKEKSPAEIIDNYFSQHTDVCSEQEKLNHLFKYVQYIERQVVLFDAIEDAAFSSLHDVAGAGSLKSILRDAKLLKKSELISKKLEKFKLRLVLTAHPTQFYPANVLGIIHDMGEAIGKNDLTTLSQFIQQLGLTPFFNKKQPTPANEAVTLMWFLENVFYHSIGTLYTKIVNEVFAGKYSGENTFIELGFWPGGDRDGNPFVNADTTRFVAKSLRSSIIVCYYRDIRKLKRKLTFSGVDVLINELEKKLYENVFTPEQAVPITKKEILDCLVNIRSLVIEQNYSLYLPKLESLIHKVMLFGTHFASLDIRQDSRIHHQVLQEVHQTLLEKDGKGILPTNYSNLSLPDRLRALAKLKGRLDPRGFDATLTQDTLQSLYAIQSIQQTNGHLACHRYIISNTQSAIHVMELVALLMLCGWDEYLAHLDIVPLFETIEDLANADGIMKMLYADPFYKQHLAHRKFKQTIMLGFSDGTKDGGYLQANWSIYLAKERLTAISRDNQVAVIFFDGRGGPPSRGGGKTHQFYESLGNRIEKEEIQLTIQGQTITSNFGTIPSAEFNIEQLVSAGVSNEVFADNEPQLNDKDRQTLNTLSQLSYEAYLKLKHHPQFLTYLQKFSPLNYYGKSNIASRPTKRGVKDELSFSDLRAIPFVGSWSQLKQNIPGFFGFGSALKTLKQRGQWNEVEHLFHTNSFFRSLIDNSVMSMVKSNFELTQYIEQDSDFRDFRQIMHKEYILTRELYLELTKDASLMEKDPLGKHSILLRERIVLPLLTIQQFALSKLQQQSLDATLKEVYTKLVTRSMFGVINAARNSV
ncbi:MAG: phosphoenolpyruvate carboxylase [Bacteroidetes bacterium]|nr:phosphoenolpyruvate carboxylase [Bacteroidota bacterium]